MLDAAPAGTTDASARETLLEVNNIEVIYNHVILVLKGVSLSVPKGGITALLGGNGAGKTTTLKAISGLLASERGEVTKGSIKYHGEDIQHADPAETVKKVAARTLDGGGLSGVGAVAMQNWLLRFGAESLASVAEWLANKEPSWLCTAPSWLVHWWH